MSTQHEHLRNQLAGRMTPPKTELVRNTFLAGAALSTGILVALTQVGARETSLKVAVASCAIASPIWLCLAAVLEAYLHLGEELRQQLVALRTGWIYATLQALAGVASYVALCAVVYFLLPWALYIFLVASVLGVSYVLVAYVRITKHLLSTNSPSDGQGDA